MDKYNMAMKFYGHTDTIFIFCFIFFILPSFILTWRERCNDIVAYAPPPFPPFTFPSPPHLSSHVPFDPYPFLWLTFSLFSMSVNWSKVLPAGKITSLYKVTCGPI